jgi:hypothetical protein
MRLKWEDIVLEAAAIVNSYSTSVTLRQLFYRLVSRGTLPNNQNAYKGLSKKTAEARREGWFPDLIDRTRRIERYQTFSNPEQALRWLSQIYMRDRTEGQQEQIFIAVEKAGMVVQLQDWFGDLGLPIMALGGYSSQTFVKTVGEAIVQEYEDHGRDSILLYAGDFDPSGEDIDRDFIARIEDYLLRDSEIFTTHRIGLLPEHIAEYQLPEYPGKETDSRKWQFIAKHGKLVQVELDALDPNDLRRLYQDAIDIYWDPDTYNRSLRLEAEESELLGLVGERLPEVRRIWEEGEEE